MFSEAMALVYEDYYEELSTPLDYLFMLIIEKYGKHISKTPFKFHIGFFSMVIGKVWTTESRIP